MEEQDILGDADVVSLAGASKIIADGNGEILLEQIKIACGLHQVNRVVLLHHSDCGAYKNSYKFNSPAEEKDKQIKDMEKAEQIIKEKFPQVEIVKIWADMKDGDGREVDFIKIR